MYNFREILRNTKYANCNKRNAKWKEIQLLSTKYEDLKSTLMTKLLNSPREIYNKITSVKRFSKNVYANIISIKMSYKRTYCLCQNLNTINCMSVSVPTGCLVYIFF